MQTMSSSTSTHASPGEVSRNPAAIAAAVEALQALDHATFLEVVAREADRRHESILLVGRALACELWGEGCADLFPAPAFDESVWAEIRRDGRWEHVIETAVRDLRSQAALVVDVVVDSRSSSDDGPSNARARRYAYDDDE